MKVAYPDQFVEAMDLGEYVGETSLKYLIASTPRCGSHMLGHALYEAGGFGVPLEYFNGSNLKEWKKRFSGQDLQSIYKSIVRLRSTEKGVFGVKAHWDQYNNNVLKKQLQDDFHFAKVIFLYRADLLSQSISLVMAKQTGAWISSAKKQKVAEFEYDSIVEAAVRINKLNYGWWCHLSRYYSADQLMVLKYEDLIRAGDDVFDSVGNFISPNSRKVASPLKVKKQSSSLNPEWRQLFLSSLKPEHGWIIEPKSWEL